MKNKRTEHPFSRTLSYVIISSGVLLMAGVTGFGQTTIESPEDERTIEMNPFTITAEVDSGYTSTTAITASKIGTLIKNTPLNIQVLTSDFIDDTAMVNFSEITNYSASFSGDAVNGSNFNSTLNEGVRGGALSGGGSGSSIGGGVVGLGFSNGIRLRAFPISNVLRNGLPRAGNHSLKAVDRVEVVKGPVAIFYGQSAPGGAINYMTKRPVVKRQGSITSRIADNGLQSVDIDYNQPITKGLGLRVFGTTSRSDGWRNFEHDREEYIGGVVKWDIANKLSIILEGEYLVTRNNIGGAPIVTNPLYHNDYFNPPDEILFLENGASSAFPRVPWNRGFGREASIAAWQRNIKENRNNWMEARYAAFPDEGYPFVISQYGLAGTDDFEDNREVYDNAVASIYGPEGNLNGPDGYTKAESKVGYFDISYRPFSWFSMHAAGNHGEQDRSFRLNAANLPFGDLTFAAAEREQVGRQDDIFTNIQADVLFEFDVLGVKNSLIIGGEYRFSEKGRWRVDRSWGGLSTLYKFWNPLVTPEPPLGTVYPLTPIPAPTTGDPDNVLPGIFDEPNKTHGIGLSKVIRHGAYVTQQASFAEGRAHTMIGVRHEKEELWDANSLSFDILGWRELGETSGTSGMIGGTFEVRENVNIYASYNQNYKPNTGSTVRAGDRGDLNAADLAEEQFLEDETGTGIDFGLKFELYDHKFSGQVSLFQIEREGIARLNYERSLARMVAEGWTDVNFRVQYYANGGVERARGIETEFFYVPVPNWQSVVTFTHYFETEVVNDPSLADFQSDRVIGNGLPNVSRDRVTLWSTYRLREGSLKGFSFGGGARLASESSPTVYSWNYDITNKSYFVIDARIGYEFELWRGKIELSLNAKNLTDELYSEGGIGFSPPRTFIFTSKYSF